MKKSFQIYFSDPQCVSGCNKRLNPRFCMDCRNDKFYYTAARFQCIETCGDMPIVPISVNADLRTGNITDTGDLGSDIR